MFSVHRAFRGFRRAAVAMAFFGVVAGATHLSGCKAPGGPGQVSDWDWKPKQDGGLGVDARVLTATCEPAQGSHSMPARSSAMSTTVLASGARTVSTEDLFGLFKANCGGCHVDASLGNFHVTSKTFSQVNGADVLAAIRTDDPAKYMPPQGAGGKPFSMRAPTDSISELARLLEYWVAQGRPDLQFTIPSQRTEGVESFLLSPDVGNALTDIGNCVPGALMFGAGGDHVTDRDDLFAAATELPDSLMETDLFTLDAAELARNRVVAFAPAYPLWSDDAGKLRHIRVPKGQTVKFDKQTQSFKIPPNTRFYKTFLKKVIDIDGNETFRKMETRLIVSRPDRKLPDGTFQPTALFGTYVWNGEETEALLSKLPLRDGTPFTDRLLTYTVDEPKEAAIRASMPANLRYELEVVNPTLKRRYAVPGSQRCIQCHMGSTAADFVLGFLPIQIARRPEGVGGIYEPAGPDELAQLQRLIDYGVITGISSEADIVPLEKSQGSRKPRNDHELKAQAYLLGNCAHCHNPRGFPSVKSSDLKDLLDFMPSAAGGIFQFPLDRFSPLRVRGQDQNVPIPYITPSLREYPAAPDTTAFWTRKFWDNCVGDDPVTRFFCGESKSPAPVNFPAPWRSLMYRNVDTPFMYADDFAIFPHMPMHTAGFDCRAPRILGDWMVSIPAVRKDTSIGEDAVPNRGKVDSAPQPYVEVGPEDPRFATATSAAEKRLKEFHQGGRYGFCPDQLDIVDRAVVKAGTGVPRSVEIYDPMDPTKMIQPDVGVPARAHWVITDVSDPPGDWYPRRPDWKNVLVAQTIETDATGTAIDRAEKLRVRTDALEALNDIKITPELRDFALKEIPFGLWEKKAGCQWESERTVSSFNGTDRWRWMDGTNPAADAPVYMQSPGSAVFNNICVNCHGPAVDSKGLLADAIMNMTGGTARVANFRDGLLGGPIPGANRMRVFDPSMVTVGLLPDALAKVPPGSTSGLTADDWGGRYMAWMALGGTNAVLPYAILNLVGATKVLGVARPGNRIVTAGSPNMLMLAQTLCTHVLPAAGQNVGDLALDIAYGGIKWDGATGLIDKNADAEMWQRLCGLNNRQIVRVPYVEQWKAEDLAKGSLMINRRESLYFADAYPADAEVMDHRGNIVRGVKPDNLFPVCLRKPSDPAQLALSDKYIADHPFGSAKTRLPYCPAELFAPDPQKWKLKSEFESVNFVTTYIDGDKWAMRGAANAGLVVFLYLDQLVRGQVATKPSYNHCELLKK